MIDLVNFYKENVHKEDYYWLFSDQLLSYEDDLIYDLDDELINASITKDYFCVYDDIEAIKEFRKIIMPENEKCYDLKFEDSKFKLLCFLLDKYGYEIKEFPLLLKRPDSLYDFAHDEIRTHIGGSPVRWEDRRNLISSLNFIKSSNKEESEHTSININTIDKLKKNTIIKTCFDEYKIIAKLAEGGNGRVYDATNKDDEHVAIKFLYKLENKKIKRFKNEIYFCEHYENENIVKIIDRGYAQVDGKDVIFYVMPLYSDTLRNRIIKGIPHDKILEIFFGILRGLKFAHEHNCIHRDIKPENIMFTENSWQPIICDFGIAHFCDGNMQTLVKTEVKEKMGNYSYSAPEQINGDEVVPQTDLYAAGLILNEMFTGQIPFATGYKKIVDVDSDYGYLDNIVESLFMQTPNDRLYPENRIINEIKILSNNFQIVNEKNKLLDFVIDNTKPSNFNLEITNKEYRNGKLIITLDKNIPDDWYQTISFGSYTCTQIDGYEHCLLELIKPNKLAMNVQHDISTKTYQHLISYIKSWVESANELYNDNLKKEAINKQRIEETRRKEEIERLNKEIELNNLLLNTD